MAFMRERPLAGRRIADKATLALDIGAQTAGLSGGATASRRVSA